MCDPLVGGLIAGAASLAGGAMQAMQLSDVQNKQNDANNQWLAYQQNLHNQQVQKENQNRQQAEAAAQEELTKVSPQAQQQTQTTEQQRLNTLYNNPQTTSGASTPNPNNVASMALTPEQSGNKTFMDSLTSQVNNATTMARNRISALATANSYGGSFGGLGTVIPLSFQQSGQDIQKFNDFRRGDIAAFGVGQAVPPEHYVVGSGTEMLGGIAKSLGGIAGTLAGNSAGSWGGGGIDPFPGGTYNPNG